MLKENRKITKTATETLKILWEEGVFRKWMKIAAVVEELSKREYNFPLANVNMALQRASYLIHKGKRGSYEYIQKYPHIREDPEVKSKIKKIK